MKVSGAEKLVYLTLGIMFLVLGVVGLIVPILPGVLFLAGALYMLSRGSQRVKRIADEHPRLQGLQARMDQFDAVSILQKVQVTLLVSVQATTLGLAKAFAGVRRLIA